MTDELPPWVENPDLNPNEIMDQYDPGDDRYVESEEERWHIRSDSEAEWAMAHVAAATDQIAAIDDQRQLWQQQLDAWHNSAVRQPQRTVDFFADHLARYTVAVRESSGDKIKSIKLASGEIGTSKTSEKVIIIDDEKVIAWAEENDFDEVVKVTKKALVTPLRKIAAIDQDGKVVHHEAGTPIPGVDVEPENISAKVKPRPPLQRGAVRYALDQGDA